MNRLAGRVYGKRYSGLVALTAVFYKTPSGNEPVRAWLQGLPKGVRRTIGEDVAYVQRMWPIGKPLVDAFGEGLWEVRSTHDKSDYRVLFSIVGGKMYLLHGFMKQTAATPKADKALAQQRLRDVKAHEKPARR
jgi:phage-related protein